MAITYTLNKTMKVQHTPKQRRTVIYQNEVIYPNGRHTVNAFVQTNSRHVGYPAEYRISDVLEFNFDDAEREILVKEK